MLSILSEAIYNVKCNSQINLFKSTSHIFVLNGLILNWPDTKLATAY